MSGLIDFNQVFFYFFSLGGAAAPHSVLPLCYTRDCRGGGLCSKNAAVGSEVKGQLLLLSDPEQHAIMKKNYNLTDMSWLILVNSVMPCGMYLVKNIKVMAV